jgi:hypothetical protein
MKQPGGDNLSVQERERRLERLFQGSLVVLFGYALFALFFPNEDLTQVMLYLGVLWLFVVRQLVRRQPKKSEPAPSEPAPTGSLSTEEKFTIRSRLQGGLGGPKAEPARPLNDFPGLES